MEQLSGVCQFDASSLGGNRGEDGRLKVKYFGEMGLRRGHLLRLGKMSNGVTNWWALAERLSSIDGNGKQLLKCFCEWDWWWSKLVFWDTISRVGNGGAVCPWCINAQRNSNFFLSISDVEIFAIVRNYVWQCRAKFKVTGSVRSVRAHVRNSTLGVLGACLQDVGLNVLFSHTKKELWSNDFAFQNSISVSLADRWRIGYPC